MTRAEALRALAASFAAAGLEAPARDAQLLLLSALGLDRVALLTQPEGPVSPEQAALLEQYGRRRLAREPVARILGEWEFWGLPFRLSPETLVPRPATETVVETALRLAPPGRIPLRILDLGTGTGCLLVALTYERPEAVALGVDLSPGALRTARGNAELNGVGERCLFAASRWGEAVRGPFDLVVSNPPYVSPEEYETLQPEIRLYEPYEAVLGVEVGAKVAADARALLRPGGRLVLECGDGQAAGLAEALRSLGYARVVGTPDLAGRDRVVEGSWNGA